MDTILDAINRLRGECGADPLRCVEALDVAAQKHAKDIVRTRVLRKGLQFAMKDNRVVRLGQNVGQGESALAVVNAWTGENGPNTTQLVWKSSEECGLGVAQTEEGQVVLVVNFWPPGNTGDVVSNVGPRRLQETVQQVQPTTPPVVEPAAPEPVVEPAAREPVVEPAAPEPVVEPAAPEPEVEPATPEPEVEPAAPEPVVEPAAPEPEVEPAAPAVTSAAQVTAPSRPPKCVRILAIKGSSYDGVAHLPGNLLSPSTDTKWRSQSHYSPSDGAYRGGQSLGGVRGEWLVARIAPTAIRDCRLYGEKGSEEQPVAWTLLSSPDGLSWTQAATSTGPVIELPGDIEAPYWGVVVQSTAMRGRDKRYGQSVGVCKIALRG